MAEVDKPKVDERVNVRIFVTDCEGPISKNDNAFEVASRFIPERVESSSGRSAGTTTCWPTSLSGLDIRRETP